jgi:ATP/ADP translocase
VTESKTAWAAPATAAALIAQQVGGNAIRDGLFLSFFAVQSLPYFMAGAAVLAILAAQASGRLLARFGPMRMVPVLLASNAALFLVEWLLLGSWPRAAVALLYMHSGVLGGIAISAFWSLLNERFDPHSAKALMARVAGAATFGGFIGGVSAERVAAALPQGALLPMLSVIGGVCVAGALAVSRGAHGPARAADQPDSAGLRAQFKQQPLLRDLALVVALAASVAALVDYVFKAQAVEYFGKGPQLVRFFGLFYSFTGLGAVLIQSMLGPLAIGRLGLAGSVASHPAAVGGAVLLGFVIPAPWGGLLPRAFDLVVRNSTFRAGYELLYTPLAATAKRSAKSVIDVAFDCTGKGLGAVLILVLGAIVPSQRFPAIEIAAALVVAGEFVVARRLRAGYVSALEGGLRRQDDGLEQAVEYSMTDFTAATSIAGLDRAFVLQAVKSTGVDPPAALPPADPVLAALAEFRSGDLLRIRAALRNPPKDPLIIGALVQLLARDDLVRSASQSLASFGERAAGEMVSALLDPGTSEVVRRRLPLALKSCPSPIARDGLQIALTSFGLDVRLRCGRALLALTDEHPALAKPFPELLSLVDREVGGSGEPQLVREHVFNLLALALDREPVRIAARAFTTDDAYVRGTALEYLDTVLPPHIFATLRPLLSVSGPPSTARRPASEVRADLIRAGTTMTVSLDDLRRQLDSTPEEA